MKGNWILHRVYTSTEECLGVLSEEGGYPHCVTLEKGWLNNKSSVSCIPPGDYDIVRFVSPHFGDVFMLIGVTGRKYVLIHWGNFTEDTEGCIILGRDFYDINEDGTMDVEASKYAFGRFMEAMEGLNKGRITILDVSPAGLSNKPIVGIA